MAVALMGWTLLALHILENRTYITVYNKNKASNCKTEKLNIKIETELLNCKEYEPLGMEVPNMDDCTLGQFRLRLNPTLDT